MSYVIADPEMMTSAATDLAAIGSNVSAAHMVAAARTTSVIPAAADEVSTGIAQLFSQHAANYQGLAAQAAALNGQFVQHLTASAGSFAHAEAANASLLQPLTASIGSGIGALQGRLLNLFNTAWGQLLNNLDAFVISHPMLQELLLGVSIVLFIIIVIAVLLFINVLSQLGNVLSRLGFSGL